MIISFSVVLLTTGKFLSLDKPYHNQIKTLKSRNTDNAWMESTAIEFMDNDGLFNEVLCQSSATWVEAKNQNLFASHKLFIKLLAKKRGVTFTK